MSPGGAPREAPEDAPRSRRGIGGLRRPPVVAAARAAVPDRAVSAARASVRRYGSLTAARRPPPEYLVIGAKKGGTTSVANWLAQHPQVMGMIPRWQSAKSPHYFDINYWRGPDWYRSHFPTAGARVRQGRKVGAEPVVGESSPYYLFHPAAPERIAHTLPEVRLIAILREPVSRAYSNYWDRRATGHEDLPSFEEALAAEPARLSRASEERLRDPRAYDADHDHHAYLRRGEYAAQLRRYLDHVDRDRLLVLSFDDLREDRAAAFDRVQSFLGLERAGDAVTLESRNVRSGYPPIDPATAARLREHYAPHNRELEELLGRELGWPRD